jgi:hypothetical protein
MKARRVALALTLLAAGWLNWFGDALSGATRVLPTEGGDSAGRPVRRVATPGAAPAILELRARSELIGNSGVPAALFDSHSWTSPPPPVEVKVEPPPSRLRRGCHLSISARSWKTVPGKFIWHAAARLTSCGRRA